MLDSVAGFAVHAGDGRNRISRIPPLLAARQSGGLPDRGAARQRRADDAECLAKLAGRSVQTVSGHLAKHRAADIVRYDSAGKEVRYWLKHHGETRALLKALEKVVHAASKGI